MKFEYHLNLERNEWKKICIRLLPEGLRLLRQWLRYKQWFPRTFVSSDSVVSKEARLGDYAIIRNSVIGDSVSIGDFTTIGEQTSMTGSGKITIGKFCSIGPRCVFLSVNHNHRFMTTYPLEQVLHGVSRKWDEYVSRDICLGNDVWVGEKVTVTAGAEIGDGCIIAAGCVVPGKKFPCFSVIGGVPGRVIKDRFDKAQVERVMEMEWWNKTPEVIFHQLMNDLHSELK